MVSNISRFAIALEQVDIHQELEQMSNAIAPDFSFDFIHTAHRNFAENAARDFNRLQIERIEGELRQGRQILEAKERLTRRKEFSLWKQTLKATAAEIRKRVKLVQYFGDFALEKVAAIASATNIYALCNSKFAALIEEFKKLPILAADVIRQKVKEARPPRKVKQQPQPSVEWERDLSGGGRHLSINLYDDELAVEIKSTAEEQQITAQRAIADAFRKSKLVEEVQREKIEAIAEVREMQIELQRENIRLSDIVKQQDKRIEELKAQLVAPKVEPVNPEVPINPTQKRNPVIYIENFDTWEELAGAVDSESDRFVAVMKLASEQERSQFTQLLSDYCNRVPNALEHVDWVPPRFLDSALRYLSFSVKQFADTSLAEDPVFETIHGCKFVGFKEFGTRNERWGFQLPDGKTIPVFERSWFTIEQF